MKAVYISIFIIPLVKLMTSSPVKLWLESTVGDEDVTINGVKQPSLPPWAALGDTPGKHNWFFFLWLYMLHAFASRNTSVLPWNNYQADYLKNVPIRRLEFKIQKGEWLCSLSRVITRHWESSNVNSSSLSVSFHCALIIGYKIYGLGWSSKSTAEFEVV